MKHICNALPDSPADIELNKITLVCYCVCDVVMHQMSMTPPTNMHLPPDEGAYGEEGYPFPPGHFPQHQHQIYEDPGQIGTNGYPEVPEQNGLGQPYTEDVVVFHPPMNVPPNDPHTPPMGGDGMMPPIHLHHTGMLDYLPPDHLPNYTGVGGGSPDLGGTYPQQQGVYAQPAVDDCPGGQGE